MHTIHYFCFPSFANAYQFVHLICSHFIALDWFPEWTKKKIQSFSNILTICRCKNVFEINFELEKKLCGNKCRSFCMNRLSQLVNCLRCMFGHSLKWQVIASVRAMEKRKCWIKSNTFRKKNCKCSLFLCFVCFLYVLYV